MFFFVLLQIKVDWDQKRDLGSEWGLCQSCTNIKIQRIKFKDKDGSRKHIFAFHIGWIRSQSKDKGGLVFSLYFGWILVSGHGLIGLWTLGQDISSWPSMTSVVMRSEMQQGIGDCGGLEERLCRRYIFARRATGTPGTLELTRDTRRLRWPPSRSIATKTTSWKRPTIVCHS